ncbi:substrate-binding domain-containing protein [Methanogenium organophilum]|uniref:Substrate-binding domain-containing protein n=1 Tax=Methanogenium organophilum TaxID=2199 RepID=A0A9X9S4L2_METOG|nr:substrate-binding domain-containing protein [Methanogenium organophilum]WAI01387.1 substrate-binding domain-containing protein [Methanogenium organophilum]
MDVKKIALVLLLLLSVIFIAGCTGTDSDVGTPTATATAAPEGTNTAANPELLRIATTTSLDNTGLLEALQERFEKDHDVTLQIIAAGTGKALEYGQRGDVDVLMVHDRSREDTFIDDGYGINRRGIAYNYFMIVGPESDPAGIAGMTPEDALTAIYTTAETNPDVVFISRGDSSGTHAKEQAIWTSAGYDYETEVEGAGDWYVEGGQGMGATLNHANEKFAYTLSDSGTYLSYKTELDLVPLVDEGDSLLNVYSAMQINPEMFDYVNSEMAREWINFLITPETQEFIGGFGVDEYGQPLFFESRGNFEVMGITQAEAEVPISA